MHLGGKVLYCLRTASISFMEAFLKWPAERDMQGSESAAEGS